MRLSAGARRRLSFWSTATTVLAVVGVFAAPALFGPGTASGPQTGLQFEAGGAAAKATSAGGSVCGDLRIRGLALDAFDEGGGCRIPSPVSVSSIGGVTLSPVAVLRCSTARRLADWIDQDLQRAALDIFETPITRLIHVSAYVCRPRNNAPGAKLSYHATGEALDIAAFERADGRRVRVSQDWSGAGPAGASGSRFLKTVWRDACGPFGTVLGPEADPQHEDHFHFDIASRRTPYCR